MAGAALRFPSGDPGSQDAVSTERQGAPAAIRPRLLNLQQAAAYLSVSAWTMRDYLLAGYIPSVQLPAVRTREGAAPAKPTLRRVLVDQADLDVFVEARKTR